MRRVYAMALFVIWGGIFPPPAAADPPVVTITSPTSGSTVTSPTTISASATSDVGIAGVQFFVDRAPPGGDRTPLGAEDTIAPYSVTWDTISTGSFILTAVARDTGGFTSTSEPVTVTLSPLTAHWKFDEQDGTTAADSSGIGHDGTLINGPVRTAGRINGGLSFDGVDDRVDVAHAADLNAFPLSISAWFKTSSTHGIRGIVNKFVANSYNGYNLFLKNGNLCAWYFRDTANFVYDGSGCTFNLAGYNDDQWHHAVYVVDAEGAKLYVDTVLRGSLGWTGIAGPVSTTEPVHIGYYPRLQAYGIKKNFAGVIDEVRIYPRALSAAQVADFWEIHLDENDAAIVYTGTWAPQGPNPSTGAPRFSGGSAVRSNQLGASATLIFTGTRVRWIGLKCDVCGVAAVSIDGGPATMVDTGSVVEIGRPATGSQVVFTSPVLADATHTITIIVTHIVMHRTNIFVDAFDVMVDGAAPPTAVSESAPP